ncbi:chromosome segregation protein SMC [Pseudomonas sp. R29(2017)]|uniref:chromosome segregation protein SMC n=1 Tax=unclassified Pseudomonas TaxID=196821 RepID=UPI0035308BE3
MDEINQLTAQRDQHLREAEQHHAKMAPLEALLEGDEVIEADRLTEIHKEHSSLKLPYDSSKHRAWLLDARITRREQLLNHETLMAGYTESMANWKADEQALYEKRDSLSTRLAQIQQQAEEDMTKARQAETDAATAYAQAVAWGDTEGEKNANADAQKAAKNLTTATEHNRRQHLIITALEQELVIVDQHIDEAQREHQTIQRTALSLARTVLEEQWNEQTQALMELGGKLWNVQGMLGSEHLRLMKLVLPQEGEDFHSWSWRIDPASTACKPFFRSNLLSHRNSPRR